MQDWAGNFEYRAARVHEPATVEQLCELLRRIPGRVRALGSRHSFSSIADTTGDLISMRGMNRILDIDSDLVRPSVTIEGGISYGQLCESLQQKGLALHNLASLPHISVAGACATATHGSGDRNANLAGAVRAMQIAKADGTIVTLSREHDGDRFDGAVVHLGALGIVTQLTLDLVPAFEVRQSVFERFPWSKLDDNFDDLFSGAYSVSCFHNWIDPAISQIWLKSRVGDAESEKLQAALQHATPAPADRHPLPELSAENCTPQMGVPGPWYERLPHFKMGFTPSSGEELQSEYFVARKDAVEALHAVRELREQIAPRLHVTEIRTIAADRMWMSPMHGRDTVGIHFTWKKDWPAVQALLPAIEAKLEPFKTRPHWGKLFTMSGERLRSLYPRLKEFQSLMREFDPQAKFENEFLASLIGD